MCIELFLIEINGFPIFGIQFMIEFHSNRFHLSTYTYLLRIEMGFVSKLYSLSQKYRSLVSRRARGHTFTTKYQRNFYFQIPSVSPYSLFKK